ncbi:hypothetical protein EV188_104378 [Actinomycetospora succinea]|uniref:Uncharacterized protein n=1 Tax=Actinomycetospora succinea TaxID=663603 RepID=A0A4R6VDH2_9PSEU|nr:hypothetical protein [Actinomycetospora succinea]TDQ58631.1 hypothetical protein EV188_104378 [Actinomycetospora succinea]
MHPIDEHDVEELPLSQQVFVLYFAEDADTNLGTLNTLLSSGWSVAKVSAMSGTGELGDNTPGSLFPYSRAVLALDDGNHHKTQEASVVWFADTASTNLNSVNQRLGTGREVVSLTALSGTWELGPNTPQSQFPYSRALVIHE